MDLDFCVGPWGPQVAGLSLALRAAVNEHRSKAAGAADVRS